ncbi:DUF4347 domain-containing protein [Leptolyngbya sp. FACHB-36]|uniref:DUF4347 domain-containing protein n=1 Tax=Leptolyngbya sp. FACHB-36 TaxID=2692808 RepID=UPI00167FE408|nr:DUF4347 domain-containing protein [Leptolyngbya sp. FACHB-36]MBD2022534.1 DUF4347 domain-containing protein [Leptolyngbya sp. FACHB-36]
MDFPTASTPLHSPLLIDSVRAPLAPSSPLEQLSGRSSSLLFIDGRVSDYQSLVAGVQPGTEVQVLDASQDAVTQITRSLSIRSGISSVQIVSHGTAGALQFGSGWLDWQTLRSYAGELQAWSGALTEDADILLYGCNVGQGAIGQTFVQQLAQLTGADVAASNDVTGSAPLGGNWELEVQTGAIESSVALQQKMINAYTSVLLAGDLDPTFGNGGKVTSDFSGFNFDDSGESVAVQSDGKIVVAGYAESGTNTSNDFALVRYNANGTIDTSFGNSGKVTTDFGFSDDKGYDIAIQSDGKIVVAGTRISGARSDADFAVARFNANGTIDTSFGNSGKVTVDFSGNEDSSNALAIQSDGKIVVAGYATSSGTGSDFALVRFNANGTLDTSFDTDGKVTTSIGNVEFITSIALQSDGKIVVMGSAYSTNFDFALARYNTNGSLDTSFGTGGTVLTDFNNSYNVSHDVVLQSDGKIVATGITSNSNGTSFDFALARYNTNGSLDTSFGSSGQVTTDFSGYIDGGLSIVIQSDGKLVVSGFAESITEDGDFALARYNTNGSLDTSFGSNGKTTTDFGSYNDGGSSIAIQSDGRLVVVGTTSTNSGPGGSNSNIALARYEGTLLPTVSLSATDTTAAESPLNTGTYQITRSNSTGALTVKLTIDSSSSTTAADYTFSVSAGSFNVSGSTLSVTLPDGQTSVSLILTPVDDPLTEPAETLKLNLTTDAAYTLSNTATTGTVTISASDSNTAPVLNTSGNSLLNAVLKGSSNPVGTLVSDLIARLGGAGITDADANAQKGIAITAVNTSNGTWQFSTNGGTTWTAFGTVSNTSARLLAPTALIRFIPTTTFQGTLSNGITFRAWDQTSGSNGGTANTSTNGNTTAFSTASETASLTVTNGPSGPDFDGDGKGDLLWRDRTTGAVAVWLMNDTAVQSGAVVETVDLSWQIDGTADFDGDGKTDILWFNRITGDGVIWKMNGTVRGGYSLLPVVSPEWHVEATVDFDRDGMTDILWQNYTSGDTLIWKMNRMSYDSYAALPTAASGWRIQEVADFDQDGMVDILWRSEQSGDLVIWQMNRMSYSTYALLPNVGVNWQIEGTADFDADGKTDILWKDTVTGSTLIWQMNGTSYNSYTNLLQVPASWEIEGLADLNGDGKPEIVWRNYESGEVALWKLDGTTIAQTPSVGAVGLDWEIIL